MDRRHFLGTTAAGLAALSLGAFSKPWRRPPNFIIVLCDDLGYGDIRATGGRIIRTPHLDRMAREGTLLTDFYAAANLCTPSRAGLLTGRYAIRTGLAYQVIMPTDVRGLPQSEVTIAEALKPEYATAMIGKWHLGHVAPYWPPTTQRFDLFYGLPYSHDMTPLSLYESHGLGVELTAEDVDFPQLQQRFYTRAERFIEDNRDRPFFLDLSLSAPHLPNYPQAEHAGHSEAAAYGDVVEEIDSIVGRLMAKLRALGLERDTLVIFTSDNGPWFEGSTGGLRQRKGGSGYDGGYRVPFIVRQPGVIPAGRRVNAIAMSIDFLPTFCRMADKPLPSGITLDGRDITKVLVRGVASPHDELVLFDNEEVVAVRTQRWKYVVADYYRGQFGRIDNRGYPQLYDLRTDASESYSVATRFPDVLAQMRARLQRAKDEFAPLKTRAEH
jgi:arylsulfatase A